MVIGVMTSAWLRHHGAERRRQRGAVAIIAAIFLVAMLGIAAFAIDIGRWFVVKNELQNAADAAALAGAGHLYPPLPSGPNWNAAQTQGEGAVGINASMDVSGSTQLSTGVVQPGYWDFANRVFDPDTGRSPGANDIPAVRVTVDRRAGVNMGPVAMTFGRIFGTETLDATATAVAVSAPTGSAGEGTLAPYAISNCLLLDSDPPLYNLGAAEQPKFFLGSGAAPGKPSGEDWNFCNGCACGQWSTLTRQANNAQEARELITTGNVDVVVAGESGEIDISQAWIQPGRENTLYDAAQIWVGNIIRVVLVDNDRLREVATDPNRWADVRGFACLKVHDVIKNGNCRTFGGIELPGSSKKPGANSCIVASFSDSLECRMTGGGAVSPGPFTGVWLPPRLVQ